MRYFSLILLITFALAASIDKISVSFEDMDIQQIIKIIARETGLNIVINPQIKGKVSGQFRDVPPEKVLGSVLQTVGYTYVKEDNIYRVVVDYSKTRYSEYLKEFKINYADLDKVSTEIVKAVPALKGNLLVSRETNSIMLKKTTKDLALVEDIIRKLDSPPLQVMVEAKIFEVGAEESRRIGSKLIGSADNLNNAGGETFNLEPADRSVYIRSMNKDMEAYISALETKSNFNMLSTPKVIAINNREAILQTTSEVAYQDETVTVTTSGPVTSKKLIFKTVGTTLKFIPHINENGYITLDLYPEISTSVKDPATNYPLIQSTRVHTQAVVQDGETFLLGGLLRDSEENVQKKVPLLGDIPLIGEFFKRTEKATIKKEVIIMLTPKILKFQAEKK